MKTGLSILCTVACLATGLSGKGQQNIQFTHYMYNTFSVNPAYAGSHEALNVTAIYRAQWVGLEGAPKTANLYAHAPLGKVLGVGLSFINDALGPVRYSAPSLALSYHLKLGKSLKMAFGASAKMNLFQTNLSALSKSDAVDNFITSAPESSSSFNAGFGTYIFTKRYYVGFSTPDLITNKITNFYTGSTNEILQPHFYGIAGALFEINSSLKFKPSVAFKSTKNTPSVLDISGQFLIGDKLWAGAMLRLGDAAGVLVGYQFTNQLKAGYAFDFTTSALQKASSGSHELFFSYDFVYRKQEISSPRYF